MILKDLVDRCVEKAPVSFMMRAAMENVFSAERMDALFDATAERQENRLLLFSTLVDMMGLVACRVHPSMHAAYQKRKAEVGVIQRSPLLFHASGLHQSDKSPRLDAAESGQDVISAKRLDYRLPLDQHRERPSMKKQFTIFNLLVVSIFVAFIVLPTLVSYMVFFAIAFAACSVIYIGSNIFNVPSIKRLFPLSTAEWIVILAETIILFVISIPVDAYSSLRGNSPFWRFILSGDK